MKPKITVEDLFESTTLDIDPEDYQLLMNKLESDHNKARQFEEYHELMAWYIENDFAPGHYHLVKRLIKVYEKHDSCESE